MAGADFATEIGPKDKELFAKVKGLGYCFLWMNHPGKPFPGNTAMENVAGCFDTLAEAISLIQEILNDRNDRMFRAALQLMAEAQSALRAAITQADGPQDADQSAAYKWLRMTAEQEQIYIQRFMQDEDAADPNTWADISQRIVQLKDSSRQVQRRVTLRSAQVNRIRQHVGRILAGGTDHDWRKVIAAVEEMVKDGVPPSNIEIRELLLPVLDGVPDWDELPSEFRLVLREIDRFQATAKPLPTELAATPIPEVQAAARLLTGRSLLFIGGVRRGPACDSLQAAFGLKEMIWVETDEHEAVTRFEPYVSRSDVAAVMIPIRWISHGFADIRSYCDRYDKPLVRLPGGYNLNQVAFQIMQQAGKRLEAKMPRQT